jgi:hypothetical protein
LSFARLVDTGKYRSDTAEERLSWAQPKRDQHRDILWLLSFGSNADFRSNVQPILMGE